MKINAKIKFQIVFVLVMSMVLFTIASFAVFSTEKPFDFNVDGGEINAVFTENTSITGSNVFSNKGDKYSVDFEISNEGNCAFEYEIELTLTSGGLEQAVLLYIDNEFKGTLSQLFAIENTVAFPIDNPLYIGETASHIVEVEYHIGAGNFYSLPEKDFGLTIGGNAKQIFRDTSKIIFIENNYQFLQTIDYFDYSGYTIQLFGDITLARDILINKPLNINIAGNNINMGSYSITYNYIDEDISRLYSTRSGGSIYGGIITCNTPNALVINEKVYANENFTISSADYISFKGIYDSYIKMLFDGGVKASSIDIEGNYQKQLSYFGMSFSSGDITIINNLYEVSLPDFTEIVLVNISFTNPSDTITYEVEVWGSDSSSIANQIVQQNFYFLQGNFGDEYVSSIARDILLPTKSRTKNSDILWISSNRDVLSEQGKYNAPYISTEIELSAIISFNGVNVIKEFKILALPKTPKEKLREICLLHGVISFVQYEQIKALPDLITYDFMGLDSISYSLPASVTGFFTLDHETNSLALVNNTDIESTFINIQATFGEETVDDIIEIRINILRNISYWDAAYNYLTSFVSQIEENTLNSVEVPDNHKTDTLIEYFVIPGAFGEFYNTLDVNDYIKISDENDSIIIVREKLPADNTLVTIKALISYQETTEERFFTFTVGGVLQYGRDIEDINLYQELRKLYDSNNDWHITRDEIDSASIETVDLSYHNIVSIKGIRYFTNLKSIDLSNNSIVDVSPLSNLYELENLNLSNNNIQNIEPLSKLTLLGTLNLAYNGIKDISGLQGMNKLVTLYLNHNLLLSDFSAIQELPDLLMITAYNTQGVTTDDAKNENVFITAHQNAYNRHNQVDYTYFYRYSSTAAWRPNATQITASKIINYIIPIYEFSNVIYLPYSIKYLGTTYNVNWQSNNDSIVDITLDRAYITQPISDIDVSLSATIEYNGYTLTKFFKVLSRSGNQSLTLYNGVTYINAQISIPDNTLRYKLFERFDTNGNGIIDNIEIATAKGDIDFSNLNIKNLSGIEYFNNAITVLDLRDNSIEDLSVLQYMTNLNTLSINNSSQNLSALLSLTNLNILTVYGLEDVNSNTNLGILYDVFINNAGITIYKDSFNNAWNPYIEPMTKALKNIQGIFLLYAGNENRINLTNTSVDVVMYNGDIETLSVAYARDRGSFGLLNSNTQLNLYHASMPARDDFGMLRATITKGSTSISRFLTVISVSDVELYLEVGSHGSGNYELLTTAVPDEVARRSFIGRMNNTTGPLTATYLGNEIRYISYNQYIGLTSITFSPISMSGIKGIEYLQGTSLQTITLNGYVYKGENPHFNDATKYKSLSDLNSTAYPSLINLTINFGVIDLFEIKDITSLVTLRLERCSRIIMDRIDINDDRESVFSYLPNLQNLYLHNNIIRDFWAISVLQNVTTLTLYGNTASSSTATNNYVEDAYASLTFGTTVNYQILAANVFWESSENIVKDLNVTIGASTRAKPTSYYVNYVNPSNTASLPLRYKSSTNNVVWTATKGGNAYSYLTGAETATITFLTPTVAAYIVLVGTVSNFVSLQYVFVVQSVATNPSYLNLADFMDGGEIVDNNFVNLMLGRLVNDYNGLGIYAMTDVAALLTINEQAPTYQIVKEIYRDIRGIRNFTALTFINLSNHSISNIEELYYLENLQTIRLFNNTITSLTHAFSGNSVFYNMNNLQELQLQDNPSIPDYYPIAERQNISSLYNLRLINIVQSTTTYAPAVEDEDTAQNKNVFDTIRDWWAQRKTHTTNGNLTFFSGQTLSNNSSIQEAVNAMNALDAVVARTDVSTGVQLGSSITIDVNGSPRIYPLFWDRYGTGVGINVTSAGIVDSINAEIGFTNHTLKMRVYTYLDGTTTQVSKIIKIGIDIESNIEDDALTVEITHSERTTRYSHLAATLVVDDPVDANKVYTVSAKEVIPDNHLRNHMFFRLDSTPLGVLSLTERNISISYFDVSNRHIEDITGLDLFPRLQRIILTNNKIREIPELYISAASTTYELALYRNVYLKDISNLGFEGGAGYVSIGSKLTRLDLRDCYSLNDDQMVHLSGLPSLQWLYMNGIKISDYTPSQAIYKTVTRLWINNYRTYANLNNEKISKAILDSYNGIGVGDVAGLTTILNDIIEMERQYEADGTTEYPLPQTFTLGEYSKEYDLIWTVPVGTTTYSINQSGGIYYLTIGAEAEAIITINARVTYQENGQRITYSESFEIITTQQPDLDGLYDRINGQIWSRFDENLIDIETIMPDPVLRYYFFKIFDTDSDGVISETELKDVTRKSILFNEAYPYISTLEGIEYLFETESIYLRRLYAYDCSFLGEITSLKSLTFYDTIIFIDDVSFLNELTNLETLNLDRTGVTNFGFVMTNENIKELLNISYASRAFTQYALFTRNAFAYARMYNNLSDNAVIMGNGTIHINTYDEKYASVILDQIPIDMLEGSQYEIENLSNTIALPEEVSYRGEDFAIEWISLSHYATISGGSVVITENHYVKDCLIVARITYNGANYERLFSVRYTEL